MEYRFEKFVETEYVAVIEADSVEEAKEKLTREDFEQCDKPYVTNSYIMDDDGMEYEWEPSIR